MTVSKFVQFRSQVAIKLTLVEKQRFRRGWFLYSLDGTEAAAGMVLVAVDVEPPKFPCDHFGRLAAIVVQLTASRWTRS